jgi:large subunit ribosomal protein L3
MKTTMGLLGKKIGMTQVFNPNGSRLGVTAVEVGPCWVVQKRTVEKDGYSAIQVGFGEKPERVANRPELGHFAKAGIPPKRHLREFRVPGEVAAGYEVGQQIDLTGLLAVGDKVDVTGTSKGKGFQGVFRRYGFHGGKSTHGVHEVFRHGGSLGQNMTPGRVMKGKKMAGHQGDARVTVKNVEVVRVFPGDNMVFLAGPIPGSRNGVVELNHSSGR